MLKYLLDTNICIYIIKESPTRLIQKFKSLNLGEVGISSITLAELRFGVAKSLHKHKNHQALNEFILPLEILPFDGNAADCYGEIRASLQKKGTPIGALDMMIAAHTLSLNAILVTNNVKEFKRVNHLKIENWA